MELDAAPDDLLVALVRADQVDLDDDGLVHRARDDDAAAFLAPAALVLGLGLAGDRLPLAARRHAAAPLLRTQPTRHTLALLLRLGLGRGGRFLIRSLLGRRLLSRGLLGGRLLRRSFLGGSFFGSRFLSGGF